MYFSLFHINKSFYFLSLSDQKCFLKFPYTTKRLRCTDSFNDLLNCIQIQFSRSVHLSTPFPCKYCPLFDCKMPSKLMISCVTLKFYCVPNFWFHNVIFCILHIFTTFFSLVKSVFPHYILCKSPCHNLYIYIHVLQLIWYMSCFKYTCILSLFSFSISFYILYGHPCNACQHNINIETKENYKIYW